MDTTVRMEPRVYVSATVSQEDVDWLREQQQQQVDVVEDAVKVWLRTPGSKPPWKPGRRSSDVAVPYRVGLVSSVHDRFEVACFTRRVTHSFGLRWAVHNYRTRVSNEHGGDDRG